MKVLILDDDVERANSLKEYLYNDVVIPGAEITILTNIDEAKNIVKVKYFDVLVLDVVLPKRKAETPNFNNSFHFLHQISRSNFYKKPEKIIGITAHESDISNFKEEFEKYCLTVIEAANHMGGWREKIANSLGYTSESKFSRKICSQGLHIVTVHGIRTYGTWQNMFQSQTEMLIDNSLFHSYKYGYFSAFSLCLPFLRNKEVNNFYRNLKQLLEEHSDKKIVIFSHSFGTYVTVFALKKLIKENNNVPVETLVLSGSVLKSNFDWSFLNKNNIKVVNECAYQDKILLLSEAFVPGLGMAGKIGFKSFNNDRFVNRFYNGGHSSYFEKENFIKRYWIPLLTEDSLSTIGNVDERIGNFFYDEIIDQIVILLGKIKNLIILFIFVLMVYFILK